MSNPFDFGNYGASPPPRPHQPPPGGAQTGGGNYGGFGGGDQGSFDHGSGFGGQRSFVPEGGGSRPAGGGFGDGFDASGYGGPGGSGTNLGGGVLVGKPPVIWLYLGLVVAAIGAAAAALSDNITLTIPAWVLAGPFAIGFLTVFILIDTKSQSAPIYSVQRYVPWLYRGLLLVAAIGVGLSAWRIAIWVGHL